MASSPPFPFQLIPPEIQCNILYFVDVPTVVVLRMVSHYIRSLCAPIVVRPSASALSLTPFERDQELELSRNNEFIYHITAEAMILGYVDQFYFLFEQCWFGNNEKKIHLHCHRILCLCIERGSLHFRLFCDELVYHHDDDYDPVLEFKLTRLAPDHAIGILITTLSTLLAFSHDHTDPDFHAYFERFPRDDYSYLEGLLIADNVLALMSELPLCQVAIIHPPIRRNFAYKVFTSHAVKCAAYVLARGEDRLSATLITVAGERYDILNEDHEMRDLFYRQCPSIWTPDYFTHLLFTGDPTTAQWVLARFDPANVTSAEHHWKDGYSFRELIIWAKIVAPVLKAEHQMVVASHFIEEYIEIGRKPKWERFLALMQTVPALTSAQIAQIAWYHVRAFDILDTVPKKLLEWIVGLK